MGNKPVKEREREKKETKLKIDLPPNSPTSRGSFADKPLAMASPTTVTTRLASATSTGTEPGPSSAFGSPASTPSLVNPNHKERPASPTSSLSPEHLSIKASPSAFTTPNPTPPTRSYWPWANQITSFLYLGGMQAAKDYDGLLNVGVTHILNVADDVQNFYPNKFIYKNLNVKDFGADEGISRVFKEAYDFINKIRQCPEHKVLVHCFAGQNRSVTVTVAVLMMLHQTSLRETFMLVRSKRPAACPFPDNREQLIEFEKQLLSCNTMTLDDFVSKHPLSVERIPRDSHYRTGSTSPGEEVGRLPGLYSGHRDDEDDDYGPPTPIPMEDADIPPFPPSSLVGGSGSSSSGSSGSGTTLSSSSSPPTIITHTYGSSFRNLNLSLVRGNTFSGEARRIIRLPSYSNSKSADDIHAASGNGSGRPSLSSRGTGSGGGEGSSPTQSPRPSLSLHLEKEILSPTVPAYVLSPMTIKDMDTSSRLSESAPHNNSSGSISIASVSIGSQESTGL